MRVRFPPRSLVQGVRHRRDTQRWDSLRAGRLQKHLLGA